MTVREPDKNLRKIRSGFVAGFAFALFFSASCHAPGKPDKEEETASAKANDFQTLYSSNCEGCHGVNGKNGPGRILNDSLYLSFIPKAEFKKILVYGRAGTAMPAWSKSQGGPLTDKQLNTLVNGVYSHWAHPFYTHGAEMPAYSAAVDSGNPVNGKKLFSRSCFMCHGPGAPVGLITSSSYLALVSNQMLRTSIVVGRPDLGMPSYLHLKAGKALSDADITDIVAYISSLRPADKGPMGEGAKMSGEAGSSSYPGSTNESPGEGNKPGNSSQSGGTIEKTAKEPK